MTNTPPSPPRRRLAIACCLAAVSLAPATTPDLVPPGRKKVRNEAVLDWGDTPREQRFVAYPTGRGMLVEIRPGEPFPVSGTYGTRIYAVPMGAELPSQKEPIPEDCPWPRAGLPMRLVWSTGESSPLARIVSTLTVRAVRADGIELACTAEHRYDKNDNELSALDWVPLAAIAAAGALLVFRFARRPATPTENA